MRSDRRIEDLEERLDNLSRSHLRHSKVIRPNRFTRYENDLISCRAMDAAIESGVVTSGGSYIIFDDLTPNLTETGTAWTLSETPTSASRVMVFLNGNLLRRVNAGPTATQYTVSGTTLTTGRTLIAGERLEAIYPTAGERTTFEDLTPNLTETGTSWTLAPLRGIDRLRLSRERGTAALLRLGLCRALASSPAASAAALGRHLRLLDHAASAMNAGRTVSRAMLRALIGDEPDQLLMWEVVADPGGEVDLEVGERETIVALLAVARQAADAPAAADRLAKLRALLADRVTAVVFTTSRDTLAWLRDELGDAVPAWVTGDDARIGRPRTSRESVSARASISARLPRRPTSFGW